MVAAADGQEGGPSGIGRSGASGAAAASDEEDEDGVSISVQFREFVAVFLICTAVLVFSSYVQQYWCFIPVY